DECTAAQGLWLCGWTQATRAPPRQSPRAFVLSALSPHGPGLSLVVGLVLYISSINDEMLNRTKDAEAYFSYKYGWSFAFAAISFLLTESAGVMSVYLFMKRYTAEDMYRPHPGFYRPRLSNCSDYSGQFLHPDAWVRGRSPSDISSEASLQMNSNYPALLKCPDYDQMSSSPC
ncbi:voltage-dependent calcium channel gamma-5 subunit, partial [Carlito syrichta]|uniref:Voltage-dependent calcium channel gamma-5 subunit n=1 Tax=Carlito syrichta TaxID=1868482 RepID=A0A1U7T339_CARSF